VLVGRSYIEAEDSEDGLFEHSEAMDKLVRLRKAEKSRGILLSLPCGEHPYPISSSRKLSKTWIADSVPLAHVIS